MDKAFFESFEQHKKEFASRAGLGDEVRAELVLGSGRVMLVDKIVETTDAWLHVDAFEIDDEDKLISIVLPYYQINHVVFMKPKPKPQAGFR